MKLVHKASGAEVKLGDRVKNFRGEWATVEGSVMPNSPASTGRIGVIKDGMNMSLYHYPDVWNCEWVNREDRANHDTQMMAFDEAKAKRFKETTEHAKAKGWETFVFGGHTFLVRYAEYLCEYLRQQGLLK